MTGSELGEWSRQRECGCYSRRLVITAGSFVVLWTAILVVVLILELGPLPLASLILLWPILANLHMALLYAFDVDSGPFLLTKVAASSTVVFRSGSGTPVPGNGKYDATVPGAAGLPPPALCCSCGCCICGIFECCLGCRLSGARSQPAPLDSATCGSDAGAMWEATGGSLWLPAVVWFFPALLWQWALWVLRHAIILPLAGERPYDLVAPGIFVGRWPAGFPVEFPSDCPNIVDMTAEFPEPPVVLRGRRYACVPSLDCMMPLPESLIAAVAEVQTWSGATYVHCANGHGRSSCFAALLMLVRGHAPSWRAAFASMKAIRPYVNIHGGQAVLMDSVEALMRSRGLLPEASESPVPDPLMPRSVAVELSYTAASET